MVRINEFAGTLHQSPGAFTGRSFGTAPSQIDRTVQ